MGLIVLKYGFTTIYSVAIGAKGTCIKYIHYKYKYANTNEQQLHYCTISCYIFNTISVFRSFCVSIIIIIYIFLSLLLLIIYLLRQFTPFVSCIILTACFLAVSASKSSSKMIF